MFLKKTISAVLTVLFLLAVFQPVVFAEEASVRQSGYELVSAPEQNMTQKEREELYLHRLFYGTEPSFSTFAVHGSELLHGEEKRIYNTLQAEFRNIAENGGVASFTLSEGDAYLDQFRGVNAVEELQASFKKIMLYLLNDHPDLFYWMKLGTLYGMRYSYYQTPQGKFDHFASVEFSFLVDASYVKGNPAPNAVQEVDGSKIARAKTAKENAQQIAAELRMLSCDEFQKLYLMKEIICSLTEYNQDAIQQNYNGTNDPWQMIYVFDGDPKTGVVCEGYSKAFQYLCDMVFPYNEPSCYCVSGLMSLIGQPGSSPHMWNLVTIAGQSYLVDVTNCDAGTVGGGLDMQNRYVPGNGLFMRNIPRGNVQAGENHSYCVTTGKAFGNQAYLPSSDVLYQYDADTLSLYGDCLNLEAKTPEYIPFDFNENGQPDLADYETLKQRIANLDYRPSSRKELLQSDLNRDNVVDAFDVALLDAMLQN